MARTQLAHFSATVLDELGTEASTVAYVNVDPATALSALATDAGAWAADLDPIIGGQITGLRLVVSVPLPGGLKDTPDGGSRVEQTGVFNFGAGTNPRRYGVAVPSIADGKISAGKINILDTDVAAFIDLMKTAVTALGFTNSAGQEFTRAIDAVLSFRKRRRQLSRSSFEVDSSA